MMESQVLTGRVVSFDSAVGLGRISADDGFDYGFHCVEIADGSREIEVGSSVAFVALVKLGDREAAAVRPVESSPAPSPG